MENCNKLWGMTNDLNGITVSKINIYMCIDDPYNLYQNVRLNSFRLLDLILFFYFYLTILYYYLYFNLVQMLIQQRFYVEKHM